MISKAESDEGRYEWLNTTSVNGRNALHIRAGARTLLLFAAVAVPFAVMTLISGTAISNSLGVLLVIGLQLLFWFSICRLITMRFAQAPTAVTVLLAIWLLVSSAVPAAGRIAGNPRSKYPRGAKFCLPSAKKLTALGICPRQLL